MGRMLNLLKKYKRKARKSCLRRKWRKYTHYITGAFKALAIRVGNSVGISILGCLGRTFGIFENIGMKAK